MPTLTTSIKHSTGSPSHSNQTRKRSKRHPNWKKRDKLSLYADDTILHIENPKDSTQRLLDLINEFNKKIVHENRHQKKVGITILTQNRP